jgi:hypothetical protein
VSYLIARTQAGVYTVVRCETEAERIMHDCVMPGGKMKTFDFSDEAEKECKRMNKERLARHRALVASQGRLELGGDE